FMIAFMDGACFEIFLYMCIHLRHYYYSKLMNVGLIVVFLLMAYYIGLIIWLICRLIYFRRDIVKLEALRERINPSATRFGPADILFINLNLKHFRAVLFPYIRY